MREPTHTCVSVPVPGLVAEAGALLDEQSSPAFPEVFRALTRDSWSLRTAVTRVRLSTLGLGPEDLRSVGSFRVLLAEASALTLGAEARGLAHDHRRAATLDHLLEMMEAGTLQVRAAPLAGWSPDFTVFESEQGPRAVLVGAHWFERPFAARGPALATLLGADAARRAAARHEETWQRAHDIGPALWSVLARARRRPGRRSSGDGPSPQPAPPPG